MTLERNPTNVLRIGNKNLENGRIGLAKKAVVRAALLLEEQGNPPEEHQPLINLAREILLGEAIQTALLQTPSPTKRYLQDCTNRLKEFEAKTKRETLRKLALKP